ncbi:MAG: SOS response-associated peptidase [Chloroflexi bacterium]|nr:SOS response-associated peptidase [Chloroflexota bacterium]
MGEPNYNIQQTANARAETVDRLPSFKEAFRSKRVLIPVTGFYDWRLDPGEKKKTPYKACLKSGEMFSLAGLFDGWKNPNGDYVYTFSIITCEPNELWAEVHNRMPVIMPREGYEVWLDTEVSDPDSLKPLLRPYPADEMTYIAYDRYVNKAGNKDQNQIKPTTPPMMKELAQHPRCFRSFGSFISEK